MKFKKYLCCYCTCLMLLLASTASFAGNTIRTTVYYVSKLGDDHNPGTKSAPFKTVKRINGIHYHPGDIICFQAGQIFNGTLKIGPETAGNKFHPIVIRSYGKGRAIIDADSASALVLYKTEYISIENLCLKGLGRKKGNTKSGLNVINSGYINIKDVEISGFQKAGLLVYGSSRVNIRSVIAHDNGFAGISLEGSFEKQITEDVKIINCRAENNPGDPTNLSSHSGNGIIAGHCKNVLIDHCTATNNGWDMPRKGNGPVGIWAYEADHVVIQYCLAYLNKTSKGGEDGGGFDFDGGVTNSIIQYCVSYQNQGAGYCLFQYKGAQPWHNNIIRYNIGENDGAVSPAKAGIYVWNSSEDPNQFYNCQVYSNIIYNSKVAAISFSNPSQNKDFHYYKNIFVAKDKLIIGKDVLNNSEYVGNDWWSLESGFNMNGIKQIKTWAAKSGKEMKDGKIAGLNQFPGFKDPGRTAITSASQLRAFSNYKLSKSGLSEKLNLLQLKSNYH